MTSMIRFLRDVTGGATSITAAMVGVMVVGGTALISDHVWLVDQRDVLKSAADAATLAATLERNRLPDGLSDRKLNKKLRATATRYVKLNLAHLPKDRYERAVETLTVNVFPNRHQDTVGVSVEADLGGALFASRLPIFAGYTGPSKTKVKAGVERVREPVDVVLALDTSSSMKLRLNGRTTRNPDRSRLEIVRRAALRVVDIFDGSAHIGVVPWSNRVNADSADWPDRYAPEINNHRRYPPVLPLTDDPQAAREAINGLAAVGTGTMSVLGIAGGVHHLGAGTSDVQAIVLLTDGVDNSCPDHLPQCSAIAVERIRAEECTRAKEAGILVFVIAAMAPREVGSDLADELRACSSEADDPDGIYTFLNNADAESLEAAFIDIAGQLQPLRKIY